MRFCRADRHGRSGPSPDEPDGLSDQPRFFRSRQPIDSDDALVVTVLGAFAEMRQRTAKVVPFPGRAQRAIDEPSLAVAPCSGISPLAPDGPCSTFVEPHLVARSV